MDERNRAEIARIEGDFAYYDDGSVRWAPENSQGKKAGALAKRPEYAAELFDKERAIQANEERQLRNALAATRGLTNFVTRKLGKPVTEDEAIEYVTETLLEAGMGQIGGLKNPLAAIQFVLDKMEAFRDPKARQAQQERTITINMSEELFKDLRERGDAFQEDGDVVDGRFRDED